VWNGGYSPYKALPLAVLLPIILFVIFEIWFLVPLPKGPVEAWFGY
jgi:putative tricarboxylic transport membrane protein